MNVWSANYMVLPIAFLAVVGAEAEVVAAEPEVVLLSTTCENTSVGRVLVGELRNETGRRLSSVWISAGFYGQGQLIIDTGNTVADIYPLLPGQTSTFKIYGPRNPAVLLCDVTKMQEGFVGRQLTFQYEPKAPPTMREVPKFYKCPDEKGTIVIQDRPCE